MAKRTIVAKFTHDEKQYIGKRDVEMYEGNDIKTKHANSGLVLETQRLIREAVKAKNGLKASTSAGKAVSYDDIDEV